MHPAQPVCGKESFMSYTISPPEETALQAHLQKLRTQLHEDPELSWQEHRTTRLVRRELEALCLEPVPLGLPTGTAALLRGALPGPTVGLRADLDALPITERTGAEFSSRVPGVMHACGHDIHMAALLGAARLLAARREQLAGNVLFLFQPAEEAATGAMQVLEQGLFRRVPMAGMLALHVWPGLAQGQLGIRSGAILSAVDSFEITVTGRGGPNYVLNIRGVQGGHSILIVHNDNICVSNFSFRNHTYLQDCLAKFDIDSIIVSGQEYWCEDLVGDCALVNALSDLARHGNYRFYCRRIKASLTISTIMKYLDSFKS